VWGGREDVLHGRPFCRRLPNYRHDGTWLPLEAAARELGVSNTVIKNLIADGVLPATQGVTCAPWVIERVDLQRPSVQARIQAVHDGRKLPRPIRGQDELPKATRGNSRQRDSRSLRWFGYIASRVDAHHRGPASYDRLLRATSRYELSRALPARLSAWRTSATRTASRSGAMQSAS
jgi:hypothetical protein